VTCALAVGCGGDDADQAAPSEPPAWSHDPDDPELGPDAWGDIDESFEQCLAGDAQSPVDVAETTPADLPDLEFDYPETRASPWRTPGTRSRFRCRTTASTR
jgi:carbonic anhydrase